MKKVICTFLCINFYTINYGQTDSLSVEIWADKLTCNKQTADDIFDGDGQGDESFVQYFISVVNMNDGSFRRRLISANLNIKMLLTGGTYPLNKVLFSQFPIQFDEILIVIPVAWEEDKPIRIDVVTPFNSTMNSCINTIASQLIPTYSAMKQKYLNNGGLAYPGNTIDVNRISNLRWNNFSGLPSFKTILEPVRDGAGSRPVGIDANGNFTPAIFTFSRVQLLIMGSPLDARGKEQNEFTFNADYNEDALGNTANHGNYSVAIKVRKRNISPPEISTTTNPTISVYTPKNPVTINNGFPVNTTVPKEPVFTITGLWQGQWDVTNNFLKMKLDEYGYLELFNTNNTVQARGTYSFTNDVFNAKYTLSGANYLLTGAYTKNTKILSGTWKQTNSITNANGNWRMSKQ